MRSSRAEAKPRSPAAASRRRPKPDGKKPTSKTRTKAAAPTPEVTRFEPVKPPPEQNTLRLGRPRGVLPVDARRYGTDVDTDLEWMRGCIRQSNTLAAIMEAGKVRIPSLSRTTVLKIWREAREEMRLDFEQNLDAMRAVQAEQLEYEISVMRQQSTIPWARVNAARRLLADISGTVQPIEVQVGVAVDVRVRSAMMKVVGSLSADDFDRMARRDG